MRPILVLLPGSLAFGWIVDAAVSQEVARSWKFVFATAIDESGVLPVTTATGYSNARGYGFEAWEPGARLGASDDEPRPFFFSVKAPEGNYRVTITTGVRDNATDTTVRAELRRLMLESVRTAPGEFRRSEFVVNVRRPAIAGGGEVRLKDRERTSEWRAWDDRLTFEFSGARPAVQRIEIEAADSLPTLFILGDSTVCDQPLEPYASWGQMLTRFFKPTIVLANHAESGETFHSSQGAGRFAKVFSQMKPGDYLMMQFGHNDMKSVDEASYAASIREAVANCRGKGGVPIIVSPMERRGFDADGKALESLRGFPEAARTTAKELDVAFIDLHAMSKVLYEALGPEQSPLAFALANGQRDPTHHNNYGSYQLAKCIVASIKRENPNLAGHLIDDLPPFDPARPDAIEAFSLPASGQFASRSPDGN
jgi:lysophospholipase L1-like esterase